MTLRRGMLGGAGGGDPHFSKVVALLRFDGANGSTAITDVTGKIWTASGGAVLDTSSKKFGTASLALNGGKVTSNAYADLSFGLGDFTIEGWKRLKSTTPAWSCIFDNRSAANTGIGIYDRNASGSTFITVASNSAVMGATTIGIPDTLEFYHWLVCRRGTTLYAGVNGTVQAIATDSRNYAPAPVTILGLSYSNSQPQDGYHDEFRMTKGVARYTTNYTPPVGPFPDYGT